MKKNLLQCMAALAVVFGGNSLSAQTYEHMQVSSGFSADVIANGSGSAMSSTTAAVDNANYNFMSNDFQPTAAAPPAYALPATGLITSAVTPGLTYQLGPLSGNNSLRLVSQGNSGTLAFSNGVQATKLYFIASSGSGDAYITTTVNFTDATSQTETGTLVPDWFFSNAQPVAASGFGRVNRTTNAIENPTGDPRLYQLTIDILPANQLKTIAGIQFTKTSTAEGVVNIFAVTAEALGTCPSPNGLSAVSGAEDGTVSWTPPVIVPAGGYDYYVSTSSTAPADTATPTGNVASATNSVALSNLVTGIPYYVWVRSHCSDTDKGPWRMTSFVTGQITATYTLGDIPTLYTENEPTATSATDCIGTLSVNVPAGYEVASVSTSYTMSTASNGWMSEQRSLLVCTTTGNTEAAVSAGAGGTGGSLAYTRTGLDIADGATGTVNFEMRAWRTYQGFGAPLCGTTHNKVDNNTWNVTVTYQAIDDCTTPPNPTASAQEFCPGATIADLEASGSSAAATFNWYAGATGGTALPSTTVLTQGNYYVSQVIGGCESARVSVAVTITTVAMPAASAQELCQGSTVADLEATPATGGSLHWYASSTGGSELTGTTALAPGNYYVSQTLDGCESARQAVAVTITNVPLPEIDEDPIGCAGLTVANATEGPANYQVYLTETGGSPLAGNTLFETGTYYVSQTVNGCESARVAVDVTIVELEAPQFTGDQIFCEGSTLADIAVDYMDEADLIWFESEGGEQLPASTLITDGATYYVLQSLETCESDYSQVTVSVNPTPDAPAASDIQEFESGDTVADLEVTAAPGATVTWYMVSATGLEPISTDTELADGEVYYVTQTTGGCESMFTTIEANETMGVGTKNFAKLSVYPNPAKDQLTVSNGEVITDIAVINLLGQTLQTEKVGELEYELHLSHLPQGTYLLQVRSGEQLTTVKIIKQ